MRHALKLIISCTLAGLALAGAARAESRPGIGTPEIGRRLKAAKEIAKTIELPGKEQQAEALHAAEEAVRRFHSPDRQSKIATEQKRLERTVFGSVIKTYGQGEPKGKAGQAASALSENERVYLFFSSSIPDATMRHYLAAVDAAGDPGVILVMRGFVGGMKEVRPTVEYLRRLVDKDPNCDPLAEKCDSYHADIEIDPLLFRRYGVKEVPAVVFATGMSRVVEGGGGHVGPAWMIEGDASLAYLLGRIEREAKSGTLAGLIRRLQGKPE